jgi:D-alanine-D-alanine ligase
VGLIYGGRSGEHDVSHMSARTVLAALREAGYHPVPIQISREGEWGIGNQGSGIGDRIAQSTDHPITQLSGLVDLIFPVLHGPYGEDGTVQGLLEMLDLPYVGCGVLASAVGMDKALSKQLFQAAGLPQTPFCTVMRSHWQADPEGTLAQLEQRLTYPMFVKPANLGSSVGISKVKRRADLAPALTLAAGYDRKLVVEQGVDRAREIEVSILGNDQPQASLPGEVIPSNEFYDYAAKYLDDRSQLIVPAALSPGLTEEVQALAIRAFQVIDGSGLARVDFLLSGDGELLLNEINTMPGFTHASMFPRLWEASGLALPALVHRLIELAQARHAGKAQPDPVTGEVPV